MEKLQNMRYLPLVSVIMPAYNAENYISYAIESILNQTYSKIELIIVDDNSTDKTWEIINLFNDRRIKRIRNSRNRGIAYSTNRAIKESNGEYIALMDDDDIAVSTRIEMSLSFFRGHEDIDLMGGSIIIIDEQNLMKGVGIIPRNNPAIIRSMLLFKNWICNGTVMFKRKIIFNNNIWYKDGNLGMQDFRFLQKLRKLQNLVVYRMFYYIIECILKIRHNICKHRK